MKGRVYLDYAASAPVLKRAKDAFLKALEYTGNPLSFHKDGTEAESVLEHARITIARLAEAKEDAVIFTSGATEANNLALLGALYKKIEEGARYENLHVLYMPSSHASVVEVMHHMKTLGVAVEEVKVDKGVIDLDDVTQKVRSETFLISVDSVCGETGIVFDTRKIRTHLNTALNRPDILLHTDASQLPRIGSFLKTRLGADLVALDAQKVGGIRGVGVLLSHRAGVLAPIMYGGGQEGGLRSGTPSPELAVAFATALLICEEKRGIFKERVELFRSVIKDSLTGEVLVNEGTLQAPHILNLSFTERDTEYLNALLDSRGVSVSVRSACDSDSSESRAVKAFFDDSLRASRTLRISFGHETTMKDIRMFLGRLALCLSEMDAHIDSRTNTKRTVY